MISLFKRKSNLPISSLFSERDFYENFLKDLKNSQSEVIIESPYITSNRMQQLLPVFQTLLKKGIKIHLISRDPSEHEDECYRYQSASELMNAQNMGIHVV